MTNKAFRRSVAASVLLAILLHVRFFFTPLTADEGGFLAIARAWSHGRDLYREVWVDRPQGLLVVFRLWSDIAGSSTVSIRIMATMFTVLAVVSGAYIARAIATPLAGTLAAAFVAVISSAPVLEGFIANGELLSGALSVAGLAVGCLVVTHRLDPKWMFVSGVLAGCAMSIKQSGFDGFVAMFAWLLLALVFAWRDRGFILRSMGLLTGGLTLVLAILALHGALTGWHNWWFAFAGYRLDARSALVGADWGRFRSTARVALPVLLPVVIGSIAIIIAGLVSSGRRFRNEHAILPLWLFAAIAAFMSGGQFHRHYWITLTFPVAVAGAVALATVRRERLRSLLAWAVLVPGLVSALQIVELPRDQVPAWANHDPRLIVDERMAHWYLAHRGPGETMYIFCASAAFYGNAREDPPFPYLWLDGVQLVPGAREALGAMLSSESDRPTFVALYQTASGCDPSGISAEALDNFYRPLTSVSGVKVLVRNDR